MALSRFIRIAATTGAVTIAMVGCASTADAREQQEPNGNNHNAAPHAGTNAHTDQRSSAVPGGALDSGEIDESLQDMLEYMIEEEKLAHDVYVTLAENWDARIFDNISASETRHQDSVAGLLENYGVDDPRAEDVGIFMDADLQALYDDLVDSGSSSHAAAIDAGITIETLDIADLTSLLEEDLPDDVRAVLENLLAGSENHLAAFERQS